MPNNPIWKNYSDEAEKKWAEEKAAAVQAAEKAKQEAAAKAAAQAAEKVKQEAAAKAAEKSKLEVAAMKKQKLEKQKE